MGAAVNSSSLLHLLPLASIMSSEDWRNVEICASTGMCGSSITPETSKLLVDLREQLANELPDGPAHVLQKMIAGKDLTVRDRSDSHRWMLELVRLGYVECEPWVLTRLGRELGRYMAMRRTR